MRRKLTILALLVAAGAAAYIICREKPVRRVATPSRVLFVLIDTLRPDRLGAYGYEKATSSNFDRLAGEGVLFLDTRSTSSWTKPSIASLFSGVGPIVHGVEKGGVADSLAARAPALSGSFETLVEAFRSNGFPTVGLSGNPHVTPQTGLDQGFDILRRTNQFGPGLAKDFVSWLNMPFFPDSGFFQRCSAKPKNLLPGWTEGDLGIPAEVEATRHQGGVRFRPRGGAIGRSCFSVPLGHVPEQGGPYVLGLEYSLGAGTTAFVKTKSGSRIRLQPTAHGSTAPSSLLTLVPAGAGSFTMEICLGGKDADFDLMAGFVLPKEATDDERAVRWFGYLHLMNPHLPYRASPEHLAKFDQGDYGDQPSPLSKKARERVGRQGIRNTDDFRAYRAHYDASIHEADEMLGTVVAELEAQGLLADTLIIVTSDHGEEFLEHGGMSHGSKPYGELLRVPLLFHYPRALARGKRVIGPTSLLDIYPTLVDLFGFDTTESLQGASLLPSLLSGKTVAPRNRPFVTTHTPMALNAKTRVDVMISGDLKLIVSHYDHAKEYVELYDLVEDPGETTNLAPSRAGDIERLRAEMSVERGKQERLRDRLDAGATQVLLAPEDVESLRTLGYLDPKPDQ